MKRRFFAHMLLSTIIGISCGSDKKIDYQAKIPKHDDFFTPYLALIADEYSGQYSKNFDFNISISFKEHPFFGYAIAGCTHVEGSPSHRYIIFNPYHEQDIRDGQLEDLVDYAIRHEIGHCLFNRSHINEGLLTSENIKIENSKTNLFFKEGLTGEVRTYIPTSIMFPYYPGAENYKKLKAYYDKELIGLADESILNPLEIRSFEEGTKPQQLTRYLVKDDNGTTILNTDSLGEYLRLTGTISFISNNIVETEVLKLNSSSTTSQYQLRENSIGCVHMYRQ